jgi:hypothetical protein
MKSLTRIIPTISSVAIALGLSAAVSAEDFGVTSVQSSEFSEKDSPIAMRVTLLADGNLQSISAYIKNDEDEKFRVSIYDDNSGSVGALLAESSAKEGDDDDWQWETVSMPSIALTAGEYWLAICFEDDNQEIKYSTGGSTGSTGDEREVVDDGFEDPWDEDSSNNYTLSLYASTSSPGSAVTPSISVEKDISLADNSGIGTYGPVPVSVSTNSTDDEKIELENSSTIQGDVYVGVGGDEDDVIDVSGGASITGSTGSLSSSVTIPDPSAPTMSGSPIPYSYTSGITTISSDIYASSWTMSGTGIIQISGTVVIYVEDDFTMSDDAQIQLSSGASLTIYTEKEVEINGNATINSTNADPSDFILNHLGDDDDNDIVLSDSAQIYANVIANDAELQLTGSARLYGSFQGKSLKLEDNSWIFASGPGVSVGKTAPIITQWQEIDPN